MSSARQIELNEAAKRARSMAKQAEGFMRSYKDRDASDPYRATFQAHAALYSSDAFALAVAVFSKPNWS